MSVGPGAPENRTRVTISVEMDEDKYVFGVRGHAADNVSGYDYPFPGCHQGGNARSVGQDLWVIGRAAMGGAGGQSTGSSRIGNTIDLGQHIFALQRTEARLSANQERADRHCSNDGHRDRPVTVLAVSCP